mgnify:CR=1 FL=1
MCLSSDLVRNPTIIGPPAIRLHNKFFNVGKLLLLLSYGGAAIGLQEEM